MKRVSRWTFLSLLILLVIRAVMAQTTQPETLFQLEAAQLRGDMEVLADRVFGVGDRPEGYTGNAVLDAESTVADLFIDNELIANALFGEGIRPEGWIGATSRIPDIVLRNIRHDLELSADEQFGSGLRPDEWDGGPQPIYACSRTLMNIALLLDTEFNLRPTQSLGARDFCPTAAGEIEDRLIVQAIETPQEETENVPQQILAVRGDLERTADEVFGVNNRPIGWLDNIDVNSSTLAFDLGNDLEVLANETLGLENRPDGWIRNPAVSSQIQSFRNLRFNLELITDVLLGEGNRPRGWQGADELLRCDPTVQNLILLTDQVFEEYSLPETELLGDEYCAFVEMDVNNFVENPPIPEPILDEEGNPIDDDFLAESELAFAYLDQSALEYMGSMPLGTEFRAWYRNFGESSMMFVSGVDFAVFIDRRWTTLTQEQFDRLPTLDGVRPLTFCDADWCNGPSPTPTPTGRGPILDIITAATPPPTAAPTDIDAELDDTVIVDWSAIDVQYLLQRPDSGVAQVTLRICRDSSQTACEGVTSIVNNVTGQQLPVLSQFNGLNVYELPYGFNEQFTIQGGRFISNSVWLLDPDALGGS